MPISGTTKAPTVARLGVMRLGATRCDYYQPSMHLQINGVDVTTRARVDGGSIRDLLNGTPNTATFQISGVVPVKGQDVKVALGVMDSTHLIFAGHILSTTKVFPGQPGPSRAIYDCQCISYEWLLNRRKVNGRFLTTSASTIVTSLMASSSSGFTVVNVVSGLESLDEITFTNEDLTNCLDRIATRIGGYWYVDYAKDLHFFLTESSSAHAIDDTSTHGAKNVSVTSDLSQVHTRVCVEAGGANAATPGAVGATTLAVDNSTWYPTAGGTVVSGPQRITHTGVVVGGAGALVGTTVVPTNGPTVAGALAGSLSVGNYTWVVTFVTGAGESLPGPASAIFLSGGSIVTPIAPSAVAMVGTGLSNGDYRWKVSDIDTNNNETLASAASATLTIAATSVVAPTSAPTPTKAFGGSLTAAGVYRYKVSFVDSNGNETLASVQSASVTMDGDIAAPASIGTASQYALSGALDTVANYSYKLTFRNHADTSIETLPTAASNVFATGNASNNSGKLTRTGNTAPPTGFDRCFYRTDGGGATYKRMPGASDGFDANDVNFYYDTQGDASLTAAIPTVSTAIYRSAVLTAIPLSPDLNVTKRRIYRTAAGGSTFLKVADINNNTSQTYTDTLADGSLGAAEPGASTALYSAATLTIPVSPDTNVAKRRVYRTSVGGSVYKKVADVANNTATTYVDTLADGSLGATEPTVSTAIFQQASLSSIPIGPATVTSRKIYRPVASGSTYKLVTTIANNTATTYADNVADSSLGATAPVTDTSGLTLATGTVTVGSVSIPVTSTAPFYSGGGYAYIGALAVQYTGVSSTALTGVPPSGPGSLSTTVNYGVEIIAAAMLVGIPASGVGSILYEIAQGDPVNLLVTVDDLPAQAAMAALVGGDGIVEDYLQDRRLSRTEAIARAQARLDLVKDPLVTVRYPTRDQTAHSGRQVTITRTTEGISETLTIQSVTFGGIDGDGKRFPLRTVEASSRRLSFEALLRLIKAA